MSLPIGIVIGYALTAELLNISDKEDVWEYGFICKSILLIFPICFTFVVMPNRYFMTPAQRKEDDHHHAPRNSLFDSNA